MHLGEAEMHVLNGPIYFLNKQANGNVVQESFLRTRSNLD
jgi:hypothetical protein